ncbi:hypothetical protein VTH82DRAFT_3479 [Thermothelomyces myriococcoides]
MLHLNLTYQVHTLPDPRPWEEREV